MASAHDTICALASGPRPSAIAIVRVSGPAVRDICDAMFEAGLPAPRRMVFGRFFDNSRDIIDEGLGVFMPGPNSYTGEDTAELYLHGGGAVIEHALDTICSFSNTRLAEPGEFTRRAFENGRLDLVEAEGVADLIDAETRAQKSLALDQLGGSLSEVYEGWRTGLLESMALLEASIDFPDEEDAPDEAASPVSRTLSRLASELEAALNDDEVGERIRDGFRIAIIGPPNAGKSSILNRLARKDAAIVSDIPGTTRDVVEVRLKIGGQIVWVADTAGLREADDAIEAEGVRRALERAKSADIRIHVRSADTSEAFDVAAENDILVLNKLDQQTVGPGRDGVLRISATTGAGLSALEDALRDRIMQLAGKNGSPLITRRRHREALSQAMFHVKQADANLRAGFGAELVSEDVRMASQGLSGLLGRIDVEDILGEVFSTFCIGK
ncbi:tRNA uridine-5-carboxymethylaminomethyl(34) synthesis GTPase MnmE [Henriciella marina]|uniref:tRNA uridine-5-carboxymethylaminomethyl(34) synthesis GTPase MnmE n=1 Tax=Henriciella marina TaxID=453851 RepID=UPI00037786FD|nr:tRNA uridine-5-carboxymethylaminomethyl(34) synthesis GTPase MnmE [Henriciella marina]